MASPRQLGSLPRSLAGLADFLGLESLGDLLCTCYCCGCFLTFPDKLLFDHSELNILWCEGGYYGWCYKCVQTTARLDLMLHFEGVFTIEEVEELTNQTWFQLPVRCLLCLRQLNEFEKTDAQESGSDIFQVRSTYRTVCGLCKLGGI